MSPDGRGPLPAGSPVGAAAGLPAVSELGAVAPCVVPVGLGLLGPGVPTAPPSAGVGVELSAPA
ncbi:hypothetical protein [Nannocystis radixulma]|uniref:Uncharacterized protein n=1 Tax=Nannocystis radixulma TaxID=2995305 RepID=A0ABT5BP23_9BACT|nr:hypothetical protein [Nannocystis radixulma]MDC0675919.1 hypothetical protein [Nannocystis radixulma]